MALAPIADEPDPFAQPSETRKDLSRQDVEVVLVSVIPEQS